jgi:NAD(P)-dependent dehydrogenase (short-subunit alcohol dehydrogenase family)
VHTAQLVKFGVATEYGGSMYDLSKKTVLVTGASKGIGAACARQLGDAGAYVVAHYGGDRSGVEEATASIAKGNKKLIAADFSDLDAVESLWQEALAWRGRIDVLVNNAATMRFDGGAPARLLRQAVRHFTTESGGTIITLSSWAAQRGVTNPATIAYGSSKAAIHAATQTIARAYARQGILAYVIAPGVVRTRLSEKFAASQGGEEKITSGLTMGEWVPPEEIAELVVFLATGKVRHLSGATLDINGASYVR